MKKVLITKMSLTQITGFIGTLFVVAIVLSLIFILLSRLLKKSRYKTIFIVGIFVSIGSILLYEFLPLLGKYLMLMSCLGTMMIWCTLTFIGYRTYKAFCQEQRFIYKTICVISMVLIGVIDIYMFYDIYKVLT